MDRAIEEVGNDADVAADAELAPRIGFEALGHRGDPVRLFDAERHGLRVRRVAAKQGNVGSVQRRDDLGRHPIE